MRRGADDRADLRSIATGASASFAARAAGAVVMLAFQVVVARRLGPSDAGRFYLVFVVTSLLAVVGRYGTDQLILRTVALARSGPGAGERLRATYQSSLALAGTLLLAVAAGLVVLAGPFASWAFDDPSLAMPFRLGALGIVPFGLVAVQGEALKGIGRPGTGASVQSLVAPVVSLVLLIVVPAVDTVAAVAAVYVAGLVAAAVAADLVWRRLDGARNDKALTPRTSIADLRRQARPFFWTSVSGLVLAWGGVLALGAADRSSDVATYFAADRWTAVASMVLVAVNGVVGPPFAALWAGGDRAGVVRMLRSTTTALVVVAGVLFAGTVLFAGPLLGLFGEGFAQADTTLRVLALGQLVVLAGGPVTSLLVMTGREHEQATAGAAGAITLVALAVALVPGHGAVGAATAAAAGLVVNKVWIALALRRALAAPAGGKRQDEKEVDHGDVPGRVLPGRLGRG